jgi:hypothetical protein
LQRHTSGRLGMCFARNKMLALCRLGKPRVLRQSMASLPSLLKRSSVNESKAAIARRFVPLLRTCRWAGQRCCARLSTGCHRGQRKTQAGASEFRPEPKLFAVGGDWQSIYRFTGGRPLDRHRLRGALRLHMLHDAAHDVPLPRWAGDPDGTLRHEERPYEERPSGAQVAALGASASWRPSSGPSLPTCGPSLPKVGVALREGRGSGTENAFCNAFCYVSEACHDCFLALSVPSHSLSSAWSFRGLQHAEACTRKSGSERMSSAP